VWLSHELPLFVEGDILGTVGVFLSGAGSLATALGAIHFERKHAERECQKRFQSFLDGMKYETRNEEP
jgi:hypothetical protein